MAQRCDICGRGPMAGNTISHAHNVRKRRFLPNLQKIRVRDGDSVVRRRVCTRCIRSGRVAKVARKVSGA